MKKWNRYFSACTQLFLRIAEAGGALVLALLVVYLLLGDTAGRYVISVADNVPEFVSKVTPAAALALAVILGLLHVMRNSPATAAPEPPKAPKTSTKKRSPKKK